MNLFKKLTSSILATVMMLTLITTGVFAAMPAPLDNPSKVKIALVRYLSTGDFFQAYLSGVEPQAKALGSILGYLIVVKMQLFRLIW